MSSTVKSLRPDLAQLLAAPDQLAENHTAMRVVAITVIVGVSMLVVLGTIGFGYLFLVFVGAIALLYGLLLREVKRRGLSDNLVIFGLSPVLVVPILIYVLVRPARKHASDDDGMTISALQNQPMIWSLVFAGILLPVFMNLIMYFALLVQPRRLDAEGVQMRSGKRYLWRDCRGVTPFSVYVSGTLIKGDFSRELRLRFANGAVSIATPARQNVPAYVYALQMIERWNIPLTGSE